MKRLHVIWLLAGVTLLCAGCQSMTGKSSPPARPNIIFIMSDDHASQAISAYGSKLIQTPNIDRLAAEGVRFANAFCTNSICGPSRAVILTGKYSHLNGFRDNRSRFDGSQQTLAKLMQAAGYQTAIFGKWHLESDPTGFDYWKILPGQGDYYDPQMIENGKRIKCKGYVTDLITDDSLNWLERRDPDKPFFLMLHHKAPHRNWQPAERHRDKFKGVTFPTPETFDDDYATRSAAAREQEMTIEHHLTPEDLKRDPPAGLTGAALKRWNFQRYMEDYLGCIAGVDENVGRVLDYLDQKGLTKDTLVIYTSDQGFYLGEHGWFDKRFMYEESLRMPLLVRYPRAIPAGTVADALSMNLDFAQTMLDFAGAPQPADMQGRSLRPVMEGKTPPDWRQSIYYHYYEFPAVHMVKKHYGVRTDRYKLIRFYDDIDAWELYDLQNDPNELNNLYGKPEMLPVIEKLTGELARLRVQYKDDEPRQAEEPQPGP